MAITVYGVLAVTFMMGMYALERRGPVFVALFALGCVAFQPTFDLGTTTLEDSLIDYHTRGMYDEYWDRVEHNYTKFWNEHKDIPVTMSTGSRRSKRSRTAP